MEVIQKSEREFDRAVRQGTAEIEFDTHGITDMCPCFGNVCFDECCSCPFYRGYEGFIVYCNGGGTNGIL